MTGYNPVICCGGLPSRCRPAGGEVSFHWEGIVCQWSALVLVYRNSFSLLLAVLINSINSISSNNFWKVVAVAVVVKWSSTRRVVDPTCNLTMSSKKSLSFPCLELNRASLLTVLALQWSMDPELYQVIQFLFIFSNLHKKSLSISYILSFYNYQSNLFIGTQKINLDYSISQIQNKIISSTTISGDGSYAM